MKKSVCLSQDSNLGSLIYLYGLIQPIRGRNRVKTMTMTLQKTIKTPPLDIAFGSVGARQLRKKKILIKR